MKTTMLKLPMLVAVALLFFTACKKETVNKAIDNSLAARENSEAMMALNSSTEDAGNVFTDMPSGKTDETASQLGLCGVTVNSEMKSSGTLTVYYTGGTCFGGVERNGSITIKLLGYEKGMRWDDAGATLQIDFNSLRITNKETGGTYSFDGTHFLTNVTGGWTWMTMLGLSNSTVTYRHTAINFTVTFADGSRSYWNIARSKTYANTGGVKSVTIAGEGTAGRVSTIDFWGTTNTGTEFSAAVNIPIVSNTMCGLYRPVAGEYTYVQGERSLQILFGVNKEGSPVTNGNCPFGYQLTYTDGVSNTKVYAYSFK